jgi:hypothetical protein
MVHTRGCNSYCPIDPNLIFYKAIQTVSDENLDKGTQVDLFKAA